MRFGLRTLMIVLALGPPVLAGVWFTAQRYRTWQERDAWQEFGGPGVIYNFTISCTFPANGPEEDGHTGLEDDSDD